MKRLDYLTIGTVFVLIGIAGFLGTAPALWGVPVFLFAIGVGGLVGSYRKSDQKDSERKFS